MKPARHKRDAEPLHIQTPIFESLPMRKKMREKILEKMGKKIGGSGPEGLKIFLKMECYQPIGSFKIRGIGALCQEWIAAGKKQLVSSSGGNAGYAVAYVGRQLGVKVTVFVPTCTNQIYIHAIQSQGATVKVVGDVWDETNLIAQQFAQDNKDSGFVPPFDHPTIWAGNATMMDEVVTQMEKPDGIVVAVGGGGLSCGILQGLYKHHWEDVPLFCVEVEGAAVLSASLKAGHQITLPSIHTIAATLATKQITPALFDWTRKHKIVSLTVTDSQAVQACRYFIDDHRVLVEPACGVALAAVYSGLQPLLHLKKILIIVCGGIGISLDLLAQYQAQLQ